MFVIPADYQIYATSGVCLLALYLLVTFFRMEGRVVSNCFGCRMELVASQGYHFHQGQRYCNVCHQQRKIEEKQRILEVVNRQYEYSRTGYHPGTRYEDERNTA